MLDIGLHFSRHGDWLQICTDGAEVRSTALAAVSSIAQVDDSGCNTAG
jgi:hypothetical protein